MYINHCYVLMNCLFFSHVTFFDMKSILSDMSMTTPDWFLLTAVCLEYHLPSLHLEPMFVFRAEVSLLEAALVGSCFFNPSGHSVSSDWGIHTIYI